MALIDLDKFKFHTKRWDFNYDNASGSSPRVVLRQCKQVTHSISPNLILCFIDLDKLKEDFPKNWKVEKERLEKKYDMFKIIWHEDKLEDEIIKVIGDQCCGKHKLNKIAKEHIEKFINSDFWYKILKPIQDKEKELDKITKVLIK